jgi:hypothetical protein
MSCSRIHREVVGSVATAGVFIDHAARFGLRPQAEVHPVANIL